MGTHNKNLQTINYTNGGKYYGEIKKIKNMVLEHTLGKMVRYILAIGKMIKSMEKELL